MQRETKVTMSVYSSVQSPHVPVCPYTRMHVHRLTSLASVLCITNKSLHDGLKQHFPWRLKRLPSTGGRQDWGLFPSSA